MDKTTFAAVCIGTAGTIEGLALIFNRDGATLAATVGFMGTIAGFVFGVITGKGGSTIFQPSSPTLPN